MKLFENFTLKVLGREKAEELLKAADHDVTHAVGILDYNKQLYTNHATPVTGFSTVPQRLLLEFDDLVIPHQEGFRSPGKEDVQKIVAFGEHVIKPNLEAGNKVNLLVHCFAGISRSTAAAMIIMSVLSGNTDDFEKIRDLLIKAARPDMFPNIRMIGMADTMLDYSGKLLDALESIYSLKHGYGL